MNPLTGLNVVAIDPGYSARGQGNAVSSFDADGILRCAFFARSSTFTGSNFCADAVVIEQPQQDGRSWAATPAVLIKLAFEGALLAGMFAGESGAPVYAPTVAEWKGAEPKPFHHRRLWGALSLKEQQGLGGKTTERMIEKACDAAALKRKICYPASFVTHNLLDAAALGMWAIGRLPKAR